MLHCDVRNYLQDPGDHVFVDLQMWSILQTLQQSQNTAWWTWSCTRTYTGVESHSCVRITSDLLESLVSKTLSTDAWFCMCSWRWCHPLHCCSPAVAALPEEPGPPDAVPVHTNTVYKGVMSTGNSPIRHNLTKEPGSIFSVLPSATWSRSSCPHWARLPTAAQPPLQPATRHTAAGSPGYRTEDREGAG